VQKPLAVVVVTGMMLAPLVILVTLPVLICTGSTFKLLSMRTVQFALLALWICRSKAQTTTTTGLSPAASSAAVSASAAAATASTSSHTSNVQGKFFNNFYQIWLENTVHFLTFSANDRTTTKLRDRATCNFLRPKGSC
jgi:hypothetical protein